MPRPGKTWNSRLSVICFVLVFLYPVIAPAEEMKVIPKWTLMEKCVPTDPGGRVDDKFACYDFGQAKTLKKLDIDLTLKLQKIELLEAVNVDLREAIKKLEGVVQKEQENTEILQKRLTEKNDNLKGMTEMYITANKRDIFGGALPWPITALVVCLVSGFVGGYYIANK